MFRVCWYACALSKFSDTVFIFFCTHAFMVMFFTQIVKSLDISRDFTKSNLSSSKAQCFVSDSVPVYKFHLKMEDNSSCVNWVATSSRYIGGLIFYAKVCHEHCLSPIWTQTKEASHQVIIYTARLGDSVFRPSWMINVVGFLPFVGNFANLGCAIHSYKHGQIWNGHEKMAQTVVGAVVDCFTLGATSGGLKMTQAGLVSANVGLLKTGATTVLADITVRTVGRMGAFGFVNAFMNPNYHKYD